MSTSEHPPNISTLDLTPQATTGIEPREDSGTSQTQHQSSFTYKMPLLPPTSELIPSDHVPQTELERHHDTTNTPSFDDHHTTPPYHPVSTPPSEHSYQTWLLTHPTKASTPPLPLPVPAPAAPPKPSTKPPAKPRAQRQLRSKAPAGPKTKPRAIKSPFSLPTLSASGIPDIIEANLRALVSGLRTVGLEGPEAIRAVVGMAGRLEGEICGKVGWMDGDEEEEELDEEIGGEEREGEMLLG